MRQDDQFDLTWINRCVRGDHDAWKTLIRKYGSIVAHAVRTAYRRILGRVSEAEVDEVVQSIWVSLCEDQARRLRSFDGRSALSTWLTVLSTRKAIDRIRAEGRVQALKNVRGEADLARDVDTTEDQALLREALNRLPSDQQLVLKLYYFEGLSTATIAKIMKLAPNSISSYLLRARQKLKGKFPNICL